MMLIVAVVCSVVLVVEFVLHAIAMLVGMEAGIEPVTAHLGFRPHRALLLLIGVVDLTVAAGMVAGFWYPTLGTIAAGYAVVLFATLMAIRLYRHLGTLVHPPDFPIFLVLSVVLLATYLVR